MTLFRCTDLGECDATTLDRLRPICQPDVVHVVCAHLDQSGAAGIDLLDDEERARASRFVFDADRRRFIATHAWARLVLGSCLDREPESLRFSVGPSGKPRLVNESPDVRFNLSHAGERALFALSLGQEIGVDIEQHRPVEVLELARRFFRPREIQAIEALPAPQQASAFFACWVRKEAFVKALGDGLSFPLDGFEVSVTDDSSSQLLRSCTAAPEALSQWRIVSLAVEPGYSAALAGSAVPWRVMRWDAMA